MTEAADEEPLPDTASPYELYTHANPAGWGSLFPINCTIPAADLSQDNFTIGREPKCNLTLRQFDITSGMFNQISKVHCRITREKISRDNDYVVFLEDLSSNGTFVNEKKIGKNRRTIISSNDEISLASPQNKVFLFVDAAKDQNNWMAQTLSVKYHTLKFLGSGAFGEVMLVLDKKTCVKRAVKKLRKSDCDDSKITNEISILQTLQHPCIVQLIDVIETKETAYLVMEFVPNGTLLEFLMQKKRLDEQFAKVIFFQLTWAVDYLHSKDITHRDLKPENILMSEKTADLFIVKVADFGLSKIVNSLTHLKTACGTLQYTAPEVLLSKCKGFYSSRVDEWGLGVILFICLSGRKPFSAPGNQEGLLMSLILKGKYSMTGPEWKGLSQASKTLVRRLLITDPEIRVDTKGILNHVWLKDVSLVEKICFLFADMSPFASDSTTEI